MRFKGFIGPAYTHSSRNIEIQRCLNLYPELSETGTGKEGEIAHLLNTPGLIRVITVGNGPTRLIHVDSSNRVFVASGNKMYKIVFSGTIWTSTLLGTLNSSTGTMKAATNALINGDSITVFVDGTDSYAYRYIATVESFGTFASFSYSQVTTPTHVVYIDGYFIFNREGSNLFYVSEWGSFAVAPLSFAAAESDPDLLVAMIKNNRDLILFNERTTEVFVNTGNADFPFERVAGGTIQKGCCAPNSVAEIEGVVCWLGRDASGQGTVYAMQGTNPQRISTHAIEHAIQGYEVDDIFAADGYTYQDKGHSFYVLNFSSATWVYDLSTKLWHERAYYDSGVLERHRANHHCFVPQYNVHLLGDWENGKIYKFSDTTYTDDSATILRIRSSPHLSNQLKQLFCSSFQLDMETGVGLSGGVQGSDPQAMLEISKDGGATWSNELWSTVGKIGEYKARAIWRRLGSFRDAIFRVTISDPVKVVLLGAEIEVEGGNH